MGLESLLQTADWKSEKHVPAITVEGTVTANENIAVNVCIGKEIGHPNTLEHNIVWAKLLFQEEGAKFPKEVGYATFGAHGEDDVFTSPNATFNFKTPKSGTLYSLSYCNIHGLWQDTLDITVS